MLVNNLTSFIKVNYLTLLIIINDINNNDIINLSDQVTITPFLVPHRNELSETVGFRLLSSNKSIIYLPDIDDWDSWDVDLSKFVADNDILFLDGTFYKKTEIKSRDVSRIPHPVKSISTSSISPTSS